LIATHNDNLDNICQGQNLNGAGSVIINILSQIYHRLLKINFSEITTKEP